MPPGRNYYIGSKKVSKEEYDREKAGFGSGGGGTDPREECIANGGTWNAEEGRCYYQNITLGTQQPRTGNTGTIAPSIENPIEKQQKENEKKRIECMKRGGTWNGRECVYPGQISTSNEPLSDPTTLDINNVPLPEEKEGNRDNPTVPQVFTNEAGVPTGVELPDGTTYFGNPADIQNIINGVSGRTQPLSGAVPFGTEERINQQRTQAEALSGQIGSFSQAGLNNQGILGGINPQEAATQGIVGSIPRALSLAGSGIGAAIALGAGRGAAVGAVGAPATGGLSIAGGAIIGAATGLAAGIVSSMISNARSQRTDTINAQKRVLDEGKQTLNDWATIAATDPTRRREAIANFNLVLSQIDQAYRQMKLDTSRDIAKFNTALPDLAEFEAFYAVAGERDFLNSKMAIALQQPTPQEFEFLELANRRL